MRILSDRKVQPELVAAKPKSGRPVLEKVHLNAEKSRIEVTNSYMLARFPVELDEGDTSGPVPVEALKAARKPPHKHLDTRIRLNGAAEVVQVNGASGKAEEPYATVEREEQDYTYPNVDQLYPETGLKPFRLGIDARLLYDLAKALGAGGTESRVVLEFVTDDHGRPNALRPITVRAKDNTGEGAPDGLIMPVRVTE